MKVIFDKQNLTKATQTVSNVVTAKTPLVVLNNILIETISKKEVKLSATDLEVSMSVIIPAEVVEEGSVTIPAKKFNDIVREVPENEKIELSVRKNNYIIIETGQCLFKIIGLPRDDFPRIPDIGKTEEIRLKQNIFLKMLRATSFSVSYDDTRPSLKGVLFVVKDNFLTLVATDGRRLAQIKNKITADIKTNYTVIVPTKTVLELNRSLSQEDDTEIKICFNDNQIGFCFDGTTILSRIIEGDFPDHEQVIPKGAKTVLKINREKFMSAVKRASILTTHISQKVRIDLLKNKLVIQGSSVELGEAKEEVEIPRQDKEMAVAFNPAFLTDVLKNVDAEEVVIELTETERPAAIKVEGLDYVYVIMPMKLD